MKPRILSLLALVVMGLTACNSPNGGAQQLETAQFEEKQNNKEHAIKLYEEVVSKYPGSANAKVAQERLTVLKGGK
jgi:outer membrane protein assembly factor BamD (BamD/ComL family)